MANKNNRRWWALAGALSVLIFFPLFGTVMTEMGIRKGKEMRKVMKQYQKYPAIPAFSLLDHRGSLITRDSMGHKYTIASFFSSRCAEPCPSIMKEMERVQRELIRNHVDVEMLSLSLDPEYDTPAILGPYADSYSVDNRYWHLLTGQKDSILNLVKQGFLVGANGDAGVSDINAFANKVVLIDTTGKILNYYNGTDPKQINLMMEHLALKRGSGGKS